MRLRVQASNWVEWLGLRSGRAPLPLGDVWLSIFQARAIMAAAKLGVFDALRDAPRGAAELAEATALHTDSLHMLLRVLACTPYVRRRRDGAFALRRSGARFLTRDSPFGLVAMMELMYFNLAWFDELEHVLQTGRGVDMHQRLQDDAQWSVYQRAMSEASRLHAPRIAAHVPLPRAARRVLDIGGSHGLFGAAICRRRAGMRCDVLELPGALSSARALSASLGVGDIVSHRAGDALHGDLGADYDVVFIGNLLHHFGPAENLELLRRARAASRAQSTIAVWDLELPPARRRPNLIGDGMAMLFRVTSSAGLYTAETYTSWLRAAGYGKVRVRRFLTAPGQILVTGRGSS